MLCTITLRTWFAVLACEVNWPSDRKLHARLGAAPPLAFRSWLEGSWVGPGSVLGSGGAGLACWVPVGVVSRPRSEGLLPRTGDAIERSNVVFPKDDV